MESWLKTNRRAIWFGTVPPLGMVISGLWLSAASSYQPAIIARTLGLFLAVLGIGLAVALLVQLRQPRIAFDNGRVLFYLRPGPPIAVPVELVEAFFLGQGPLMLPGPQRRGESTVNLVARISQRVPEWSEQQVKPALGRWCESYVTIRGTWCEPLNGELIRRLNRRLREVTEEYAAK